jgi:hypothetical protein
MYEVVNQDGQVLFGPASFDDCQEEMETMLEAWRDHGMADEVSMRGVVSV